MERGPSGKYLQDSTSGEAVRAFVPFGLPPTPPIEMEPARQRLHDRALLACGRLDAVSRLLPQPDLFLYAYVRREAVLSSQIEGTQSSLSDLLLYEVEEAPGAPVDDVVEVSNYVAALHHGLALLKGGLPLCNRVLLEVHGILLARGRGGEKLPGEFRRSQNWVGGTRPGNALHVPPPAAKVGDCMGDLEKFINAECGPGTLVKAALCHVQFETIHPFLDGNGRLGRLLISLVLHNEGVLRQPLLYLSLYLKANRATYYDLLGSVRTDGNWEAWIDFFLRGVEETASGAVETATRLVRLLDQDERRIAGLGRKASTAMRVFKTLHQRPITSIPDAVGQTGVAYPTAARAIESLERIGILAEITGRARERRYAYTEYLRILGEGTDPLPR